MSHQIDSFATDSMVSIRRQSVAFSDSFSAATFGTKRQIDRRFVSSTLPCSSQNLDTTEFQGQLGTLRDMMHCETANRSNVSDDVIVDCQIICKRDEK